MFKKILLFIVFFAGLASFVFAERVIPKYTNFVNDNANIFTTSEENILNKKLKDLKDKSQVEFSILTIDSLNYDSLEEYAIDVARTWGVGEKEINNGLLLLIVKNDKKIRLEVGYGLEGVITDSQWYWLIQKELKPEFKKNNFFVGVNSAVDKIYLSIVESKDLPKLENENNVKNNFLSMFLFLFFPLMFFFDSVIIALIKYFGKSKEWFKGGFLGGSLGFLIVYIFSSTIILSAVVGFILLILGLLFDYFISKWYSKMTIKERKKWEEEFKKKTENKFHISSSSGIKGSGDGKSFGSFGGGSFGGGGSSGKW